MNDPAAAPAKPDRFEAARLEKLNKIVELGHDPFGQRFVAPHVLVHWLMLRVAVARRNPRAALGQMARIALREVRDATAEEISHGHVHGPGGIHH